MYMATMQFAFGMRIACGVVICAHFLMYSLVPHAVRQRFCLACLSAVTSFLG
jgi:hypothetical protein